MLQSGVHATLAGVLLAFAIPFTGGGEDSPSYRLQHFLHQPVAFVVLPLFALANTGIMLAPDWLVGLGTANSLGVFAGLLVGKPLGIFSMSMLATRLGWSQLPADLHWKHLVGVGFLGGVGFTMAIFITLLAFNDSTIVQNAKISILLASLLSGTLGFLILRSTKR